MKYNLQTKNNEKCIYKTQFVSGNFTAKLDISL